MKQRRTLVEGLKEKKKQEQAFVYGQKNRSQPPSLEPKPEPPEELPSGPIASPFTPDSPIGRMSLSTRLRIDLGFALKRASLERKLKGQTPNAVQEILDEALELWLRQNGHLP